jgi:hypothetical protein
MGDTLLGEKGSVIMEGVEEVKRKEKGKESRFGKRYGIELKLRCVKLHLEEGLPFPCWRRKWGRVQTVFVVGLRRIRNGEKRGYGIGLSLRGVGGSSLVRCARLPLTLLQVTAVKGWFPIFPRPRLFQLGGQPEKRSLIPKTACELNPNRNISTIPE